MNQADPKKQVTIFIDGEETRVDEGINVIEAARVLGKEIPHYCYHPKLSVVGNCRMCLVEVGSPGRDRQTGEPMLDEQGNPKILWMPKPAIACATTVTPGMHVKTDTPTVRACREGVMEFLLINHPLDCPICDQAGECRLQEFAADYGRGYSRYVEKKNIKPKRTRLGPRVMLDDERCILCSRCIRFCQEIADDDVLGFIDRGSYSTLTCFPGRELANNYSLNTVDICPVGALTSVDFRFKMRVWFLRETPSICAESSVGVNTLVGSREGIIYRITPRRNDAVNDTWMPDSGRMLYRSVTSEDRMTQYSLDGRPVGADAAIAEAVNLLRAGKVAIVGSGRSSVEEQWLLKQLVDELATTVSVSLIARRGEGDGILISADRNPNVRGALVTRLISALPEESLNSLSEALDRGEVDTILSFGEDLCAAGLTRAQLNTATVIYAGTHHNECSQRSKVELPLLSVFEKTGTFINQQFRVQKFAAAVPGPAGILPDTTLLSALVARITGTEPITSDPETIWSHMARSIPELDGMTFHGIPPTGTPIDTAAFSDLPFFDGKSLHFEPTNVEATR